MYSVVDIEATGGKVGEEKIIEIAIFLFDGKKIIDQFISLVQPDCEIPIFIQKLTGIKQSDLVSAPRFYEIAKRIIEITDGSIFVAHNASFDYRILKQEFLSLGYNYDRTVLDTIPLSEKFFPELPSHGLETICNELGILNPKRHRADGDARATTKFLEILIEKDREKYIEGVYLKLPSATGKHSFSKQIENLVKTIGVYYLFNNDGEVIYLGKSDQLRVRIDRHFLSTNDKAIALQKEVKSIRVEETGSMLMAEILEHIELLSLKPKYNTPKDRYSLRYGLYKIVGKSMAQWDIRKIKNDIPELIIEDKQEGFEWLAKLSTFYNKNIDDFVLPKHRSQTMKSPKNKKAINANQNNSRFFLSKDNIDIKKIFYPDESMILVDSGKTIGEKTIYLIEHSEFIGYSKAELTTQQTDWNLLKKRITKVPKSKYLNSLIVKALKDNKIGSLKFKFS